MEATKATISTKAAMPQGASAVLSGALSELGMRYQRHDGPQPRDRRTYSDGVCVYSRDRTRLIRCVKPVKTYHVLRGTRVIEPYAFEYQRQLQRIVFPEGLQVIGDGAFMACNDLTCADLPSTVQSIGDEAFFCTSLERFAVPASLAHLGRSPFLYAPRRATPGAKACGRRWAAEANPRNPRFAVKGDFLIDTADEAGCKAVCYLGGGGNVVIPEGVEVMGDYALANTVDVRELEVPATLRVIQTNGIMLRGMPERVAFGLPEGGAVELRPSALSRQTREVQAMFSGGSVDVAFVVREYDAGIRSMEPGKERDERLIARLEDGRLLAADARRAFVKLLSQRVEQAVEECARTDDTDMLRSLGALGIINRGNVAHLIDVAHAAGGVQACRQLMELSRNAGRIGDLDL